ncbi:MAG: hypothetical protein QOH05_4870, partial [Acetobacteraceae bacterium]|nr:hypothetical protein [Acetobacteraceae bacterium]
MLVAVLADEPVADGTLKSCVDCGAVLATAATAGVVSVVVPVLVPVVSVLVVLVLVVPVLAVVGSALPVVLAAVPVVVAGATNAMPLEEPLDVVPAARLLVVIAALSDVAAAPS